jgi:flagellar assembly factor FliW
VKVSTTRFGDIIIDESKVIRMKGEILGFEQLKRYVLFIQGENIPFWWFQSVDDGSIAFVVIDSLSVKPDYKPLIPGTEVKLLEIGSPEDAVLLSVVTIHSNPFKVTANLRAPIVVNIKKMLATQVILVDSEYPVQYPITEGNTVVEGKEKAGISSLVLAL